MYGWRARIGLISPMPGENVEHAFHIYAPDGVSFSSMKMPFPGPTPEGLKILTGQLEDTASKYKGQDLDLIVFCCTSGSFIQGVGWDKECMERIKQASGTPGLTTSTAVLESLNALGARSLAVLTPYPDATNEAERKFLEDNGFEVRTILGMDMSGVEKGRIYNAEKPFLYRNSVKMDLKGADVFFLSCMALDTLGLVGDLETDLGIPVVTSHQATLWSALRHCGIKTRQPHLGKLFAI
ncbi:maleate cis-trans isomerase family protein [Pseudoflavonifractor sp. HCP28S3_F10]|uniref:maleate cis-trans isomerase family protein n=1 Tax=Pseudoflavonifractor sp. HCP28S3_F10 TaxID=3438947 RepID=UPI003F8CC755